MELKTQLIKICCEGCEDKSCNEDCPDYKYIELVLAEFDRLKAENERLRQGGKCFIPEKVWFEHQAKTDAKIQELQAENDLTEASRQAYIKILDETMLENEVLQSWLDKICEPIKKGRYEGGSGWTESNATWKLVCDYLNSQKDSSTKSRGAIEASAAEPAYANQRQPNPKPSEKHNPPKCEHKNWGYTRDGKWCPDCKENFDLLKPLTQCPECIWGQIKIPYYYNHKGKATRLSSQSLRLAFEVYERCPRCKGEGRIPC